MTDWQSASVALPLLRRFPSTLTIPPMRKFIAHYLKELSLVSR